MSAGKNFTAAKLIVFSQTELRDNTKFNWETNSWFKISNLSEPPPLRLATKYHVWGKPRNLRISLLYDVNNAYKNAGSIFYDLIFASVRSKKEYFVRPAPIKSGTRQHLFMSRVFSVGKPTSLLHGISIINCRTTSTSSKGAIWVFRRPIPWHSLHIHLPAPRLQ